MDAPELSVVIPVYNNASTLGELIERLIKVLESTGLSFEAILVDDGSRDASLSILRACAAEDPRIRPYALARNFGSQAAVCAGFDLARGPYVVAMDADLENCPEDIPPIVEKLKLGFDLVCGYRENREVPLLSRRFPSWLMNLYVRRRTGTTIRDIACGMRGFQSWVIRNLEVEGEARRLLTPVFLRRAKSVTEVPLRAGARHRPGGHSFFTLLGIAVDYYMLTAGRPFLVSGVIFGAATLAGFGLAVFGLPVAGLLVASSGGLGLLLSLVGEYCQRVYQLCQSAPFYKLRDVEHGRRAKPSAPPV